MKKGRRRLVRRASLMRAAVMGAAVALSAGAPAVGVQATAAGAEAEASRHAGEQVFWLGKIGICWGSCPGYGWCCYFNPGF